jgi:lysozyme
MSNKDNHLIFERYIHNEPMNEGLKDVLAAGALGLASLAGPNKDVQAAAPTPAVQNVQDAKETIKKEIRNNEGFEERTYADPIHKMKVPTVGYGFSLKEAHVQKALKEAGVNVSDIYNVVLNKQQAEKALDILLNQAIADARALFPNYDSLPFIPKKLMTDMSYNLGKPKLSGFTELRKAIAANDFNKAADEMKDSKWYRDVKSRGVRMVDEMRAFANQGKRNADEQAIIVRQGDTLSGIAKREGYTLQQLLKANPQIKNADRINPGDPINKP